MQHSNVLQQCAAINLQASRHCLQASQFETPLLIKIQPCEKLFMQCAVASIHGELAKQRACKESDTFLGDYRNFAFGLKKCEAVKCLFYLRRTVIDCMIIMTVVLFL